MITVPSPWVVVLAGGDGLRLDGAFIRGRRLDRPKQFCTLDGAESLLQCTLRRAARLTGLGRVVAVVRDEHRRWWDRALQCLPSENILTEPANRGTAVAILHALVHVLLREADPTLVVLPSDHAVDDERVFVDSIELAARSAATNREHLLVLGVTPESADTGYGWILPRESRAGRVGEVARFVEKPDPDLARRLLSQGALWNSFSCAGSGHALLEVFEGSQPRLFRRYLQFFLAGWEDAARRRDLFQALPGVDFCRDVLDSAAIRLRVLVVPPCGWTDLGTPSRVEGWLQQGRSIGPGPAGRASCTGR